MNKPTRPSQNKMTEEARQLLSHWHAIKTVTWILVGFLVIIIAATLMFLGRLDNTAIFGFPLGYFLAVNGILILAIVTIFWGAERLDRMEQSSAMNEDQ